MTASYSGAESDGLQSLISGPFVDDAAQAAGRPVFVPQLHKPRNSSYQPDVSNEVAHTVGDER